ncbi:MAG: ABC transporter permease [Rhodobacteraceae bacterium]|nr:ABC transporter permease [Paracoccaceae bacterium]
MIAAGRLLVWGAIAFLYTPILVLIAMGFNASPLYELPFVFSTRWYEALAENRALLRAGTNSVVLALLTTAIATPLGTMAALALARGRFRGRTLLQLLLLPPIAIPWLIIGTAMLIFFFWVGIGRGFHALLIGHVALALPYVVLIVGTGAAGIPPELEDAARSLGAPPLRSFRAVTLPLLTPAILGAALFAFAVSLDQFVVSYFLATPGHSTLPVQIYGAIRKGFTPEINAISTILLLGSMAVILLFLLLARPGRSHGQG